MTSSPLPNYLRAYRKRAALSQNEVAFLLGTNSGANVCRAESFTREPTLTTALAYEVIYQTPTSQLFGGLFDEIQKQVATRAKIMTYRKPGKSKQRNLQKTQTLAKLLSPSSSNVAKPK